MFIFSQIKKLISKLKATPAQKELISSLQIGDLVWAKMPLSKFELNKIEPSHRVRPYLVISANSAFVYAYPSSSKQFRHLKNHEIYFINKTKYNKNKDSWINLTKPFAIPVCNLKQKYFTLNEFDLKNIQKRVNMAFDAYK